MNIRTDNGVTSKTVNDKVRSDTLGKLMKDWGTFTKNIYDSLIGASGGGDSTIFATVYDVDTAKLNLRTSIAGKIPYTDTTTKITTFKQLKDSLNAMSLDRASLNGATINRQVNFNYGSSGNVTILPLSSQIYGTSSGEDRWNFSSTGNGAGTYGRMSLYYNDGISNKEVRFVPVPMASSNQTITLRATSGTMAYTSDTANTVQVADSNVAVPGGYMTLPYWLSNRTTGTVTSITASSPLTGGTITTSGSIGLGTVGFANGGTNNTSFARQRLIFAGANTLKTHDSICVDTATGYLGIGTLAPTTPIYTKMNNRTAVTLEWVGFQQSLTTSKVVWRNPSGHTVGIGIQDNAQRLRMELGGSTMADFGANGAILGPFTMTSLPDFHITSSGNLGNTSGTTGALSLTCTGTQTVTGGTTMLKMNLTATTFGSGSQLYADFQRNGTSRWSVDTAGQTSLPFLIGNGSTPTIAAGTGAGTGPTISIAGCDGWGKITLTTGTSPATSATVATITFAKTKTAAPNMVSIHPADANSAALTGGATVYVDAASSTTTQWVIKVGSTGLAASTSYVFTYQIAQ